MPDTQLKIEMGLYCKHRVEGGIWKEPMTRQRTVFVDWNIYVGPWADYNAVLGEEIAHIQLHQSLFLLVDSVEDFIKLQCDPEWNRYERDARRYSLALRLPWSTFLPEAEDAYSQTVDEHGFGDIEKIEKLVRNHLAQKFRAPSADVQRRMQAYPYHITDRLYCSVYAASQNLMASACVPTMENGSQRFLF